MHVLVLVVGRTRSSMGVGRIQYGAAAVRWEEMRTRAEALSREVNEGMVNW